MRPARELLLAVGLALVACTYTSGTTDDTGGSTPSQTHPTVVGEFTLSPQGTIIELPPLSERGLAAMWSRANNTIGVSLLSLDGRVLATVPNVIIYDATGPSEGVILQSADEIRYWLLDASAHELVPITLQRAMRLHRPARVRLPHPARSPGSWAWSMPAPTGTQVLAQYNRQVSECAQPIAMVQPAPGLAVLPVTGEPFGTASSFALGWTAASEPVVEVTPVCVGPSDRFRSGVYVFDNQGGAERLDVPKGSYVFQMWG
jgi:hypothetical protein